MLFAEHGIAGNWGFSLDDSWIYATFARNLATGHGYSFNPGESIGGATGPLYVFILAGLYSLFHDVIWPAKILGFVCLCASSLLVYLSARQIDPCDRIKPLLAGLLTAISPSLLSPVVGIGLNRNSIAARNTMVLFERFNGDEVGPKDVPVYWH